MILTNLMTAIRSDWKGKLGALVVAFAIWAVIKQQIPYQSDESSNTFDPEWLQNLPEILKQDMPAGGAGGGTSMWYEVEAPAYVAWRPQLLVEEPSWILCGEYSRPCFVFVPAGQAYGA